MVRNRTSFGARRAHGKCGRRLRPQRQGRRHSPFLPAGRQLEAMWQAGAPGNLSCGQNFGAPKCGWEGSPSSPDESALHTSHRPGGRCVCCFTLIRVSGKVLGPFIGGSSRKQGLGGQEGLETVLTWHLYVTSVLSISATVNDLEQIKHSLHVPRLATISILDACVNVPVDTELC